jgi:NitT/TauT family transport system permease protein
VTPIVAVAPLIIILVKNTPLALIACATVIALFPIITNTTIGLRSVDPGLLAYFRMNKVGRAQTLWRLRVPSALPFFMAGLRISSGLALIGAWWRSSSPAPAAAAPAWPTRSCNRGASWTSPACLPHYC